MIVHTKQFLSLFSYIREMICLFALLQFCVKGSEKKLLQLNWSCWSALTSLRTCFVAGALSLSVSLCQYQITQRGAVLWQRKMNWIIFVLSIVTNSNLSSFYSPVELFLPDKMWLQWPRGYQFFIRFVEAVGVSECLGCSGLLGFLLGCSGLPRLSLFEGKLLRLMAWLLGASMASRVSFGLQWPLEIV